MPSPVHPYSDYGVALRTLRSARGWLGFLLVACVIGQLIGFSLVFWTHHPYKTAKTTHGWPATFDEARKWLQHKPGPATAVATSSTSSAPAANQDPFFPGNDDTRHMNLRDQWVDTYSVVVPFTQLAALLAVSSQTIILFISLLVVLVAQAPGVAQLTRSLIWSVLLLFMFLPWQSFTRDTIPGVVYGFEELFHLLRPLFDPDYQHVPRYLVFVVYARFIVWPLVGLFVLLITAERFRAGITIAIGHPLQSMLQPRSVSSAPPGKPGPLGPLSPPSI